MKGKEGLSFGLCGIMGRDKLNFMTLKNCIYIQKFREIAQRKTNSRHPLADLTNIATSARLLNFGVKSRKNR